MRVAATDYSEKWSLHQCRQENRALLNIDSALSEKWSYDNMPNYCVCAGCTNSSLLGVHHFPDKKRKGTSFRTWVRFMQVKRQDRVKVIIIIVMVLICMAHFIHENSSCALQKIKYMHQVLHMKKDIEWV